MYHHTPQGCYTFGNPHGVLDRKNQFARFGGRLIAYTVIGRFDSRRFIIGWFLGGKAKSEDKQAKK
tara:strand:- start:672 stop:869 length:198 start_codon:yes stop_codon:yes gene_type:complete